VLVVLAARADSSVAHPNVWLTGLDLAVGLAFVVSGAVSAGPRAERRLVGLVGLAWLVGSVSAAARSWHEAVLGIALIAFPRGRVEGRTGWLFAVLAVVVAFGQVPQIDVAALFTAVAVTVSIRGPRDRALFPALAGAGLATGLGVDWLLTHQGTPEPALALVIYEVVLLGAAVGFPVAAQTVVQARTVWVDQLLDAPGVPALDGLASVLGPAIGDAPLQIHRWNGAEYVDGRGQPGAAPEASARRLEVADGGGPVAVVYHHSTALEDPPTIEAVSSAVRLTVTHIRLQEELQNRLGEMEAARSRIIAAADQQRERVAAELRKTVEPCLRAAGRELDVALNPARPPAVAADLDTVADELSATSALIAGLVAGVALAALGDGRLSAALTELAEASPLPVEVTVADGLLASQGVETALFYVCSEALANAVKHSGATTCQVGVRRESDTVVVTVVDDGRGGADPTGSGLQGLADRVATHGGRLRVDSPSGAGTTVTATIPVSRSSATAGDRARSGRRPDR
jgi:signal transduction histidine kinase